LTSTKTGLGAARRILAAAVERHARTGFPLSACLELAASALKAELGVSTRTFAKSASHARALAAYGRVGSRTVAELAAALDPQADDFNVHVASLVEQLDLDLALYRRREGRARTPESRLELSTAVEAMSIPVYMVDPDGVVTYFNPACVAFAGRRPRVGVDRWHVAWRLYTPQGDHVPHDHCCTAQALRERRAFHWEALAERPDGSRVRFAAAPTPLFGQRGELLGAVNVIIELETILAGARRTSEGCAPAT
jgi:PAS domain-containing protein